MKENNCAGTVPSSYSATAVACPSNGTPLASKQLTSTRFMKVAVIAGGSSSVVLPYTVGQPLKSVIVTE